MGKNCYVVSACLCGLAVRYDGGCCTVEALRKLWEQGDAIAVCPECMGGLPIPRPPAERLPEGGIVNCEGKDCTVAFTEGAEQVLALCQKQGIRQAILKDGSPSCGSCKIYDGSFSGQKIPGEGVTAALLRQHGIRVYSETDWLGKHD